MTQNPNAQPSADAPITYATAGVDLSLIHI